MYTLTNTKLYCQRKWLYLIKGEFIKKMMAIRPKSNGWASGFFMFFTLYFKNQNGNSEIVFAYTSLLCSGVDAESICRR
jgi:hypothetical protein